MNYLHKGTQVHWKWGQGQAEGKILEHFIETVTKRIKGHDITRHGTKDDPAYLIEQEDGTHVLKLSSELKD